MPNLVVTKVALGADPWLINTDTPLNVTVKNDGSADASKFYVRAEAATTDGNTTIDFVDLTVDSLAAGASTDLAFSARVATASDYTITATADLFDDIHESNEKDNTKEIKATAVDLPNLLPRNLTATAFPDKPGYYNFEYTISNAGTADANTFSVVVFYEAPDGSTGQIDKYQVTGPLTAGSNLLESSNGSLPQSGTNKVSVDVDSDKQVDESDETDNVTEVDVTVP